MRSRLLPFALLSIVLTPLTLAAEDWRHLQTEVLERDQAARLEKERRQSQQRARVAEAMTAFTEAMDRTIEDMVSQGLRLKTVETWDRLGPQARQLAVSAGFGPGEGIAATSHHRWQEIGIAKYESSFTYYISPQGAQGDAITVACFLGHENVIKIRGTDGSTSILARNCSTADVIRRHEPALRAALEKETVVAFKGRASVEAQRRREEARSTWERLYREGVADMKRGDPAAALEKFVRSDGLTLGDSGLHPTRAQMTAAKAEALERIATAHREAARWPQALETLESARGAFFDGGDLQKTRAIDSRLAEWYALYGESLYQAGRWKEAEPYFKKAGRYSPKGLATPIPRLARASTMPNDAPQPVAVPQAGNFRTFMDANGFTEIRESNGEIRWWSRKKQSYLAAGAVAEWKRRHEDETRNRKP